MQFVRSSRLSNTVRTGISKRLFSNDAQPYVITGMGVGPLTMNQYVIGCNKTGEAAFIDSGASDDELEYLMGFLEEKNLKLTKLFQTHAHIDHVTGLSETRKLAPEAPIYIHEKEMDIYERAQESGKRFGINLQDPLPNENIVHVDEGETVSVGELEFKVLFTPGHSPGHVCYWNEAFGILFAGDLLFKQSIGRVDLPGSDPVNMDNSLRKLFETVPDRTLVCPGHMDTTTIEDERQLNPFIQQIFK